MKKIELGEKIEFEVSLCLGFFDSIHIGHQKIIESAKKSSNKVAVFTFKDENKDKKVVYNFEERCSILEEMGVEYVIYAEFSKIKDLTYEMFTEVLDKSLNLKKIFCGADYKYGKNALGNIENLKNTFSKKVNIVPNFLFNSERASTKRAKIFIENGEIEELNRLLGREYSVTGICEKGFQNGTKMGFPTANIRPSKDKALLKEGVYLGKTLIKGKIYKSMINVGKIPTFDCIDYKIETHALGVDEKLYGEEITVYFDKFVRDSVKFINIEELKKQLEKDKQLLI